MNLVSFYFYFFLDFLIDMYLLNRFLNLLKSLNKTLKKAKYWKSEGNLSVRKCGKCTNVTIGTMLQVVVFQKLKCT